MFNLNRQLIRSQRRDGISIIEVLTSMAVATIGVFGIMVMIPFAVKQSQSGLDRDAANAVGRNAVEEMQINGLFEVLDNGNFDRLVVEAERDAADTLLTPPPARHIQALAADGFGVNQRATGVFHFDPISFSAGVRSWPIPTPALPIIEIFSASANRNSDVDLNPNGAPLDFDNTTPNDLPTKERLLAPVAPLTNLTRSLIPLTAREASRLCRSEDELFFDTEVTGVEEIAPAQQLFDFDGTNQVKRQSSGRTSWSAMMVPEKDPGLATAPLSQLRAHVMVHRDRFVPLSYEAFTVDMTPFAGPNHFQATVSQITLTTVVPDDTLFRGDWVMLVNRIPESDMGATVRTVGGQDYRAAATGYRIQIMFARIKRLSPNNGLPTTVTIDGGSFDFVPDGIPDPDGLGTDPPSSVTYMVHLKNVINVFERSISIE